MKSLIAVVLCATALSSAAPALAQAYAPRAPGVQPGHGFREQLDALDGRVQEGIRSGEIDRGEADRATRELASIREEMNRTRAANGGELTDMDRGRLQERLDGLSRSIHWMREHGPVAGQPPMVQRPVPPMAMVPGYGSAADWSLQRREAWLQERIDHARADGSLSRRELYRVQKGLDDVRREERRMSRHGRLRDSDREFLEQRLDHLRETIRWARQDNDHDAPWRR